MVDNLTFRLFQPDDIEGILRLWNDDSGWGGITEEQFYKWYIDTPYGECLISVALDEKNRIVGQEVFTPTRIYVDGKEKKALRLSAPILTKEFREQMGKAAHPSIQMFRVGLNAAVECGYSVIYAFPVPGWLRYIRLVAPQIGVDSRKFVFAEPDCYALSLKSFANGNCKITADIEISFASVFNDSYDNLWQSAKNEFPINCAIVRSSGWIKWKLGSHCVFEVRRRENKELLGYAAIKRQTGLLVDALARTPQDLETTITAIIKALAESEDLRNQANVEEIKVMETESLASVIQKLGFEREKFKFAFWCYSIDESVPIQSLEPSRWYLMPKD